MPIPRRTPRRLARAGRAAMLATRGLVLVFLIELGVVFVAMEADRIVALFVVDPPPPLPPVVIHQSPPVVVQGAPPVTAYIPAGLEGYFRPAVGSVPRQNIGPLPYRPDRRYMSPPAKDNPTSARRYSQQ